MTRVRAFAVTLAILLAPTGHGAALASADQGVRGRAALGGTLVEGVRVSVYRYRTGTFGPLTREEPVGSVSAATDGTFRIPLSPGQYVVEGFKKAEGNPGDGPEPGDLYCLYSGSPVTVAPGAWSPVGLSLVEVPPEERKTGDRTGIAGRITLGGELVEKVYLYVYTDAATAFRGPAHFLQPVAKGTFRLRMPPGSYYLVARKRARGGPYGPIDVGDLFNFYPRNPVVLSQNEEVTIEIPLLERLSQLEEDPDTFHGLPVRVVDASGTGRTGFYVLAYAAPTRSGPPIATSSATDAEGRTHLTLPLGQTAYLRARKTLGGPLQEGEAYADGETTGQKDSELVLTLGAPR